VVVEFLTMLQNMSGNHPATWQLIFLYGNDPICVVLPKVAKESTWSVCYLSLSQTFFPPNFAIVNEL
jgi:hypothetical protein